MSYQEYWTQLFLLFLPARIPHLEKALEVLPVFITVSVPISLVLEPKGTEFPWELPKAAQVTAHGTAQGKVILPAPKSSSQFWDRVFLLPHSPSVV